MLLVLMLRDFPCELRADFQQFYGLNLDRMGEDYSHLHAAILASQLPTSARVIRAVSPDAEWGYDTQILALIEHGIRVLAWMQTKDAKSGRRYPQPLKTPAQQQKEKNRMSNLDLEFVRSVLGEA